MVATTPDRSAESLPRVSVIVPIYNAAATLPTTVPAWLSQDHPAEWLLVEDGSTDDTPTLLRSLTQGDTAVRLISHEQNRGRAAARNTGIAAATGDVILFLDADMQPEPDFVRQHALAHCDPDVIGVVSNPVLEGLDPADPYHRYLRSRPGARGVGAGRPLPFKYFIIGYTSVKANAVHEVGGFDERFSYGEDLDFSYRLSQRFPQGLRYSDRPIVHHYDHGDLDARLSKLREFGRDNLPLLLAKHPGLAAAARVDFVDSPHAMPSWKSRLKRSMIRPKVAASLRRALPYLPRAFNTPILRYIMAASIADAFRGAALPS